MTLTDTTGAHRARRAGRTLAVVGAVAIVAVELLGLPYRLTGTALLAGVGGTVYVLATLKVRADAREGARVVEDHTDRELGGFEVYALTLYVGGIIAVPGLILLEMQGVANVGAALPLALLATLPGAIVADARANRGGTA